jgi:Anaphase-promoting complex subunit 5
VHGVRIWRSGNIQSLPEDVDTPIVSCLIHVTVSEWHLGEIASCRETMAEAISLAKKLNDTNALALALSWAAAVEQNPVEADRFASELIELSTRQNLEYWLHLAYIHRGCALALRVTRRKAFP